MAGHLFIIDGDLTKIACDAILIPTDGPLSITDHWKPFLRECDYWDEVERLRQDKPEAWSRGHMICMGGRTPKAGHPRVVLGNVGRPGQTASFDRFADQVDEFVEIALADARKRRQQGRIYQWARPRLALPVIGTDHGGGQEKKGDLILGLVRRLSELARDPNLDVDLVLVTHGEKPYAAAQRARRQALAQNDDDTLSAHWRFENTPDGENLVARARELAKAAIDSQLVLFLGAGVSAGAGLPDWKGLLAKVAQDVKFENQAGLEKVDPRDQATILQRRLELQKRTLGAAVVSHLPESHYYSLVGGLLASLPSREAVTTNYDTLFEAACSTAKRTVAVLPNEAAEPNGRWLLKLHGCIKEPEKIVLTRSDYLDMPRNRGALMGLVQGLLMMRHMMFVGYSMRDEDFHELIYEVRHALGPKETDKRIGTVLALQTDPLTDELWTKDLRIIAMTESGKKMSIEARSRQLELFLDLVGYLSATSAAFFLDRTYDAVSDDESTLRSDLSTLFWWLEQETKRHPNEDLVARKVLRFLEHELGAGKDWTSDRES